MAYNYENTGYYNRNRKQSNNTPGLFIIIIMVVVVFLFVLLSNNALGNDIREKLNITSPFVKDTPTNNLYNDKVALDARLESNNVETQENTSSSNDYISSSFDKDAAQQELLDSGYQIPTKAPESNGTIIINENGEIVVTESSQGTSQTIISPQTTPQSNTNQGSYIDVTLNTTTTYHEGTTQTNQSSTGNSNGNSQNGSTTQATPTPSETYELNQTAYANASTTASEYSTIVNELYSQINEMRTNKGLNTLSLNSTICEMAGYRAYDMGENYYFSHTKDNISQLRVVMYAYNRMGMRHYENLGRAVNTEESNVATSIINGWKNSSGHYDVIINPDLKSIGIAIHKDVNGSWYVCTIYSTE